MADIDFITDIRNGFNVALGDNPRSVSGNRALLNRFEITFLTKRREFQVGDDVVIDPYGGDSDKYINKPYVLRNNQSIAGSVKVAVDQTVISMKADEPDGLPETERIDRAEILGVIVVNDVVTASIRVFPVEIEPYADLSFNLPIVRSSI